MRVAILMAVSVALGWAGTASEAAQAKAKAAGPGGGAPVVSAAGLRIVAPGLGEQGTEIRAFNESAGTTLGLFVKMSSGAGIVEMDNNKSVLSALTDDTGANLLEEARFGSFPKVTKDGTAGVIEVETRVRPSAGASSISASGSIAVRSSSGTKVVKVPGVSLAAGKAFKVGTATVTVGEVSPEGDHASVTLKLPRSLLQTIRDMRFKDAKGQAVEASRTGSGWMNEDAEVSYRVPATLKTATLELDVWQNLKDELVPFNLKFGLSLK